MCRGPGRQGTRRREASSRRRLHYGTALGNVHRCHGNTLMTLALPFRTAKQLAAAVRKKKIGCLELLDLYLKRVETYNPKLNAIIATDIEGARKRAKARSEEH